MDKFQLIAYYLPQFYEIEFNDNYWGKGYTEWTATANAKPLFKGHYQPHVPADLGFYNLLMPEIQIEQAKIAKEYGIEIDKITIDTIDEKTVMTVNITYKEKNKSYPFIVAETNLDSLPDKIQLNTKTEEK